MNLKEWIEKSNLLDDKIVLVLANKKQLADEDVIFNGLVPTYIAKRYFGDCEFMKFQPGIETVIVRDTNKITTISCIRVLCFDPFRESTCFKYKEIPVCEIRGEDIKNG